MVKLLTHMRVHSENREFECPDCGKRFKQSSQLRNHRVMHLDRKSSDVPRWYTSKTCDLCGKTYADSKCLKNHIQAVHSKLRPYVCNVCGHSSARKAMLQLHLRQHTGDKPFNCQLCDYKTGDHNSLRRHMMRHTGKRTIVDTRNLPKLLKTMEHFLAQGVKISQKSFQHWKRDFREVCLIFSTKNEFLL